MLKKVSSAKRSRRSNVERSATTRAKLIEAAIDILYKSGYSAATTVEVAKRACVSRGAMLHQFPTRVHMLLAVAQHIVDANTRYRTEQLGSQPDFERFQTSGDISWYLQSQPAAIALLEIMMATRGDRELRKGFAPFVSKWADVRRNAAQRMASDLGISDTKRIEEWITLREASLRGLAIELMFLNDREQIERARRLLREYSGILGKKWQHSIESERSGARGADTSTAPSTG